MSLRTLTDPQPSEQSPARSAAWSVSSPPAPRTPDGPVLYVATTLDTWRTDTPMLYAPDVTVDGVAYRRLDPAYYAWLRAMVDRAIRACDRGNMTGEAFRKLIDRFAPVYSWAVALFGTEALEAAMRSDRLATYRPPVIWDPVAFSPDSLAPGSVSNP